MSNKFRVIPRAIGATLLGSVAVAALPSHAALAADDCLAKPTSTAPQGSHWYYRVDRAKHRNCWYIGAAGKTVRAARAAPSATPPSPQTTERAGPPAIASAQIEGAFAQQEPTGAAPALVPATPVMPRENSLSDDASSDAQVALRKYASARASDSSQTSAAIQPAGVAAPESTVTDQQISSADKSRAQGGSGALGPATATADITAGPTTSASLLMLLLIAIAFTGMGFLVRAMIRAATRRRPMSRRGANWDVGGPPELPVWMRSPRGGGVAPAGPEMNKDDEEKLRQIWREIARRAA